MRIVLAILICVVLCSGNGCSNSDSSTTITFWHFWSEPQQRKALQQLVQQFEQHNPTLHIKLTELQWQDGKAKLQLAFNSATAPDIVHIGMEWIAEFSQKKALAVLRNQQPNSASTTAENAGIVLGKQFAAPWTLTTRAQLQQVVPATLVALPPAEPHNLLKRVLPLLWKHGSKALQTTPFSTTFDSTTITALQILQQQFKGAVRGSSHQLDQEFLQHKIDSWITGPWILDMAVSRSTLALERFRVDTTAQYVLSGDYLAVSATSKHQQYAELFIKFLRSPNAVTQFCSLVSDAGVPANSSALNMWLSDNKQHPRKHEFAIATSKALPIAIHSTYLQAEIIIERELEKVLYGTNTAEESVLTIIKELRAIGN